MHTLGIETSCDETAIAIYSDDKGLRSHALYSQVALHAQFGGVVPELASRDHLSKLLPLLKQALADAQLTPKDITGIAYTAGPGLMGALLVGAAFAKSLGFAWGIPTLAIHHMEGHLLAPMLEEHKPAFPFLALLVSGGHTMLVAVKNVGEYEILGETLDDAVGEAFDKTAKLLGLPYPGGAELAALAQKSRLAECSGLGASDSCAGTAKRGTGMSHGARNQSTAFSASKSDSNSFHFPRPMLDRPGLDFSFSGLKTYAMNTIREHAPLSQKTKEDIARAFEDAVVDTLWKKCARALKQTGFTRLVVAGGVGANRALRQKIQTEIAKLEGEVFFPQPEFCTDNAAMIAYAGSLRFQAGQQDGDLEINVKPRWSLETLKKG